MRQIIESCWDLLLRDLLFEEATAIAAAQPDLVAVPELAAAGKSALTLRWAVRMSNEEAN